MSKEWDRGDWKKEFFDGIEKVCYRITTDKFIVELTGGSLLIKDRENDLLAHHKGFNYLYTADINPAETELFALENGKHFYIFSLFDYFLKRRVTLPRKYEAIDVCGCYSKDGNQIFVPVYTFDNKKKGYEYKLCVYDSYSLELLELRDLRYRQFWDKWEIEGLDWIPL